MRIVALSGSLRARSINSALLRAASRLAPSHVSITLFARLDNLPLFNPDDEVIPPAAVERFRAQVAGADALMIASPEYAHGVTGTIKNALDWLVSFEPFAGKPVAILNASPRAHHADAALREILRTMAAVIVERASITIPLLGANLDEEGMLNTPAVAASIRTSLSALVDAVILQRSFPNVSLAVDANRSTTPST
jgi:chromate reductase, NAD(P)H dehydrogenase (quinone)